MITFWQYIHVFSSVHWGQLRSNLIIFSNCNLNRATLGLLQSFVLWYIKSNNLLVVYITLASQYHFKLPIFYVFVQLEVFKKTLVLSLQEDDPIDVSRFTSDIQVFSSFLVWRTQHWLEHFNSSPVCICSSFQLKLISFFFFFSSNYFSVDYCSQGKSCRKSKFLICSIRYYIRFLY